MVTILFLRTLIYTRPFDLIINQKTIDMNGLYKFVSIICLCMAATTLTFGQEKTNTDPDQSKTDRTTQLRNSLLPGNVGIGTTNPLEKLHVKDGEVLIDGSYQFFTSNSNTSTNGGLRFSENGSTKGYLWWNGSSDQINLGTFSDGSNTLRMNEDGGVGLGVVPDDTRLTVRGLTSTTGKAFDVEDSSGESILTVLNNGNVGIKYPTPGVDLALNGRQNFYFGDETFYGTIYDSDTNMVMNAGFGSFLIGGLPARDLLLQTNTTGIFFSVPGKVGIGVTSPTAKLHVGSNVMIGSGEPAVGYLLSVNGKIMSEEVRVQLDADWPDYVFEEDYPLLSINEFEKSIKENGHLPGVPSAEEMEETGLMLGDMQTIMMEKIEELSLYIIQLEKRIAELEQK